MVQQVLVIHPGGLGDVLLALPALRSLRATRAGAGLILMARSEIGRLLVACAEVQQSIPIEGPTFAELIADARRMPERLGDLFRRTDLAVCWMNDVDGRLTASLKALEVREVVLQSPFQGMELLQHQSDRFLSSLRNAVRSSDNRTPLQIPSHIEDEGRRMIHALIGPTAKAVALHPGSGSRHKCAAASLFVNTARILSAEGYWPIIIGGPADDENVTLVRAQLEEDIPVVTGLDLLSIAGLLAHIDLFVGHDSGLMHLTAALHRPTVAIFGPTSAARWAPRGRHVRIVSGETCLCNGWEAVQACRQKPCLQVSERAVLEACGSLFVEESNHAKPPLNRGVSPCSAR